MVRNAKKQTRTNATPGFAIEIKDDTELSSGMLIAEDEEGHYEPVGCVINISEGREIAESNMQHRRRQLERGNDPGLCPYCYKIWARGIDGNLHVAAEILATTL